MGPTPVIAIFDIGKTNKKLLLFDSNLNVLSEISVQLPDTLDEDGFPCEDITVLARWMIDSINEVSATPDVDIKAINFSAYGASFVHLDASGNFVTPLYNYLKPYPDSLRKTFYDTYGGQNSLSLATASPVLGSLNSGMQLYRLKCEQPMLFNKIRFSLHLPQYLSFLFGHQAFTDITSIGCHTGLWDFTHHRYHPWVIKEEIIQKLAPIASSDKVVPIELNSHPLVIGIGLHDSSAALVPYLNQFGRDFVLLSTGTWNITLNPFNTSPLTEAALANDCLCYLSYQGKAVKASRLFAGHAHDQHVERIAEYFHQTPDYQTIPYDETIVEKLRKEFSSKSSPDLVPARLIHGGFFTKDLSTFKSLEEAYHQLMIDLVGFQKTSTSLVLQSTDTKKLFVDGGFSKNKIFMKLLKDAFPLLEVSAATLPQASALGAAMVIHRQWTKNELPKNVVVLNRI